MKVQIVFDFHDLFVDARTAWIKAFRQFCDKDEIEQDYNFGMSKRTICEKYGLSFSKVESIYREYLQSIPENIEFAQMLSEWYPLDLVSLSEGRRLDKDIDKFGLRPLFTHIYSREAVGSRESFLNRYTVLGDWAIFFNHEYHEIRRQGRVVYMPISFQGDPSAFQSVSFTEHARKKMLYNQLSQYYMQAIANDTQKETQFIETVFKMHSNSCQRKVLDCCCGVGRHDYLLAKDGYSVTGIDISPSQIQTAQQIHAHENARYLVMDVRNIDFEETFDLIICMWTTYNYLSQDYDLRNFIRSCWHHQKKGDVLILDSKNIPSLVKRRVYKRSSCDKTRCVHMELIVHKRILGRIQNSQYFYFIEDDGCQEFYFDEEFVRFYSKGEMEALAKGYYEISAIYGDFDLGKYEEEKSERFILVLCRI